MIKSQWQQENQKQIIILQFSKKDISPKEESLKRYSSLSYPRYEVIKVDDKFVYDNSEFTGDALYDVDQIYGRLDTHNSREVLSSIPLQEKIENIKKSYDISANLRNGKYRISNGRHRLIFLKYYYLSNRDYCN